MDKDNLKLQVKIITPAGIAHTCEAKMVVAPSAQGIVGILPHHIPLFTRLQPGEIKIKKEGKEELFAVTGGFMDVNPEGIVTILTDSAQRSEEVDERAAAEAKAKAEKLLTEREKLSERDFALAEASLRKALLELKVAKKRKIRNIPGS